MIINSSLVNELFRAFHIQRWNDRIRPMELIEMDKHSHKMIIAYCLGKYEEAAGREIDWVELIRCGIFELLRRIVISDIKSPIFREIKKNKAVFAKLNEYIYTHLVTKIDDITIKEELKDFLFDTSEKVSLSQRILDASHIYASYWEFQIVKVTNPTSYQNNEIEMELLNDIHAFSDLIGVQKLMTRQTISNFIDMCSQLRFQIRWAQTPRVPKTSVLGHSLLVACISYFLTRDLPHCNKRIYNNFFGGLFHDLPEAVTRDIISPVKESSAEFDILIKTLERELAEKEIFPHIEDAWIEEMKYFTQDEFANKVSIKKKIKKGLTIDEITENYNANEFLPYDGELIKAGDHLAAFLESWHSIRSGISSTELNSSEQKIRSQYKDKTIGCIPIKNLYASFE